MFTINYIVCSVCFTIEPEAQTVGHLLVYSPFSGVSTLWIFAFPLILSRLHMENSWKEHTYWRNKTCLCQMLVPEVVQWSVWGDEYCWIPQRSRCRIPSYIWFLHACVQTHAHMGLWSPSPFSMDQVSWSIVCHSSSEVLWTRSLQR